MFDGTRLRGTILPIYMKHLMSNLCGLRKNLDMENDLKAKPILVSPSNLKPNSRAVEDSRSRSGLEKKVPVEEPNCSSPSEVMANLGIKQIWPPTKVLKRHLTYPESEFTPIKTRLLMAIVSTPYGQHLREILDDYSLRSVKDGPNAASYYELSEKQVAALCTLLKWPFLF